MKDGKKICKKEKKYKRLEKNEEEGKNNKRRKNTKCLTYETRTCKIDRKYPCKEHKME